METAIPPRSTKIELYDGEEETPSLPQETIFEEILTRLPVKSLLKFRCVAKSWCSLVASKRFIKAHLKNSIESSIFFETSEGLKQCSLPSIDKPLTSDSITYNAGIDFEYEPLSLVGCCRGLICFLMDEKRYVLWNPATKKTYNLPDFHRKKQYPASITMHGFGFDEMNHDYKVFVTKISDLTCQVYSLRTNSWKNIKISYYFPGSEHAGTYVSGRLHWCICDLGMIVLFNLNSHEEGNIALPRSTEGKFCRRLGVLRGCLSAHMFHPNGDLDVWVMKEVSWPTFSWEKVATVSFHNDLRNDSIPIPLAIGPNGEVLLVYQSSFVIYNPKSDAYKRAQITGGHAQFRQRPQIIHRLPKFYDMGICIASLVSVAPDAEKES